MRTKPMVTILVLMLAALMVLSGCVFSPVEGDVFVPLTEAPVETTAEEEETEAEETEPDGTEETERRTEPGGVDETEPRTIISGRYDHEADYTLPTKTVRVTYPTRKSTDSSDEESGTTAAVTTGAATTAATTTATTTKAATTQTPNVSLTPGTYVLRVFYDIQTVVAYRADANGTLQPIRFMPASTGLINDDYLMYTVRSQNRIYAANRWQRFSLYSVSWHQYATSIRGDYFFHSIGYNEKVGKREADYNSFHYWEYDKLGRRSSHGCIRLTVDDARFVFMNAHLFSKIEFLPSSAGYGVYKVYAPARFNLGDPTDYALNAGGAVPTPMPTPTPTPTPTTVATTTAATTATPTTVATTTATTTAATTTAATTTAAPTTAATTTAAATATPTTETPTTAATTTAATTTSTTTETQPTDAPTDTSAEGTG